MNHTTYTHALTEGLNDFKMGHATLGMTRLLEAGIRVSVGPTVDPKSAVRGGPYFATVMANHYPLRSATIESGDGFGGGWQDAVMNAIRDYLTSEGNTNA